MTSQEKQQVATLRARGISYKGIADTIGVSENCIKKYCQRNNLGGSRAQITVQSSEDLCPECGAELSRAHTGRHKRFCSDACRLAWWHKHPEELSHKAKYQYVCPTCGASFSAYGNTRRKYCSHACYIKARFAVREGALND